MVAMVNGATYFIQRLKKKECEMWRVVCRSHGPFFGRSTFHIDVCLSLIPCNEYSFGDEPFEVPENMTSHAVFGAKFRDDDYIDQLGVFTVAGHGEPADVYGQLYLLS